MSQVLIERHGPVLSLRLNRPERRNAMTGVMYSALADAIVEAGDDPSIRAICLSGAGKGFCAGNDLGDFLNNPDMTAGSPVLRFLRAVSQSQVPLVAAVHGAAIGVGTTVLLHCDLVYAAESARFALPFVNLGLVPEAASSLLLPRLMGHVRAAELILLGEPFGAQKALEVGLINAVVDEETLLEHSLSVAQKLAAKAPNALRRSRDLLKRATAAEVQTAMTVEVEHFLAALSGPEAKEALSAFFEKRAPDFSDFS
jgi:enoyl-CoA hydratase/carnithine racemase